MRRRKKKTRPNFRTYEYTTGTVSNLRKDKYEKGTVEYKRRHTGAENGPTLHIEHQRITRERGRMKLQRQAPRGLWTTEIFLPKKGKSIGIRFAIFATSFFFIIIYRKSFGVLRNVSTKGIQTTGGVIIYNKYVFFLLSIKDLTKPAA